MPTQLQIDILATAHNSVVETSPTTSRSEKWRIDLDPIERPFYGYGYGYAFRSYAYLDTDPAYDYFNVIGILGLDEGFGITETKNDGELPDDLYTLGYSYSFGYEYGRCVLADNSDIITIKATIYENNIPKPNIGVLFKSSPFVKLNPNFSFTNSFGEVFVDVSISSDALQRTTRTPEDSTFSTIPFNGWISISAEIDKNPDENEGFSIIRTQAIQLTETSVNIFDISAYSFNRRYGYCYGYTGYGYDPFSYDPSYWLEL